MRTQESTFHVIDGALGDIDQILLGSSMAPGSAAAFDVALRIARIRSADIHVLHAVPPPPFPYGAGRTGAEYNWVAQILEQQEEALRSKLEAANSKGVRTVSSSITLGSPYHQLLEAAADQSTDLIVVGASESSGRLLGSTPEKLIRKAQCPVLIVRGTPEIPFRRVLLPVDLSALSGDSLRCGLCFLRQINSDRSLQTRVLFVLSELQRQFGGQFTPELVERFVRQELDRFVGENFDGQPLSADDRKIRIGDPRKEILDDAEEYGADLIIIGTHGRGGLERALVGSVTTSVVRHATTSVLVIPPNVSFGAELVDAVTEQIEPHFQLPEDDAKAAVGNQDSSGR